MLSNECIGTLSYESTAGAIAMAGIFIAFVVEYISQRIVRHRSLPQVSDQTEVSSAEGSGKGQQGPVSKTLGHHHGGGLVNSKISVLIAEAGIIFHSIREHPPAQPPLPLTKNPIRYQSLTSNSPTSSVLGLTLVVAGDSVYITLFVVILFHQFFEGLALGSRIACLSPETTKMFPTKIVMALAYAVITPIGMAIGLGVLNTFNGNDPATVIAIATLDALSAGILLYAGVVGMLAKDWIVDGGELVDSDMVRTLVSGLALVAGMMLMGVLGKWA